MIRKLVVTSAVITILLSGGAGYLSIPAFAGTQDMKKQVETIQKEEPLEVFNIIPDEMNYDAVVSSPPLANYVVDGKLTNETTQIEVDTKLKLPEGTKMSLINPSTPTPILTQDYVQGVNLFDVPKGTFQKALYTVQVIIPSASGLHYLNLFYIYDV